MCTELNKKPTMEVEHTGRRGQNVPEAKNLMSSVSQRPSDVELYKRT